MAIHNHKGLVLLLMILLVWTIKASGQSCTYECGDGTYIRYPFGIGEGCYFDESFEVVCNYSSGSPKALIKSINMEIFPNLSYSSLEIGLVEVYVPVIPLNSSNVTGVDMKGSPFTFSQDNRLAATGCDNFASYKLTGGGCQSICTCDPSQNPDCCDMLCRITPNRQDFNANTSNNYSHSIPQDCNSVFVVQQDWLFNNYQTNSLVLKDQKQVPAVLEWAKYKGDCYEEYNSHTQICNKDNRCLIQLSSGHFCLCISGITDFCSGSLFCNTTSGQNCSKCPTGYFPASSNFTQDDSCLTKRSRDSFIRKKSRDKFIIIGCISGVLGMLLLLTGAWWLYKFVKRIKEIKLKQKFFKRNGGLLLQQELNSNKGNIEKTKLFTSKELEKATDNFNTNRILGQGGQGTVYKGMLADGKIVAVKKSKQIDESKIDEFINEVVILSQINHRNVVKLLGCCLETEVPLLVYEFIPNGTLFQYIHDQSEEFPITWEMRLRIAVEVSGAVSYLHSSASIPIYHRDIKSTNIILDDKYRAKVSDFGASRSMAVDQTHMTTQVHGTFGYLDPEYFRSSQFTEKSDVYSFGVVLAELLTGERPIRWVNFEEEKSLAAYFLCAMKEDRLFEILDAHALKEGCQDEIIAVAKLTKRCLNLNGKKRPTMREVALHLAGIRGCNGTSNIIQESLEEIDCASVEDDIEASFEIEGSFTKSFSDSVGIIFKQVVKVQLNGSAFMFLVGLF